MKYLLTIAFFFYFLSQGFAQFKGPVIKATNEKASTREGHLFKNDNWTITPAAKPDVWNVIVPKGTKVKCTLITDVDSITFNVEQGKSYDFVVLLNNEDSAFTRISGIREAVYFSPEYQKRNNNKTIIEVPPVYELMNVMIAITSTGINDSDLVEHNSVYYTDVMNWFGKYRNEKVVLQIDSLLKKEWWKYFYLKMDSYAFSFDGKRIRKGATYDRLNFDDLPNTFEAYLTAIESFSIKTDFLKFYENHKVFYDTQLQFYKDSLDVKKMQRWLNTNFPTTSYNCFKVIFSPLVGGSQSAKFFRNSHFREAQAHVNFPYARESDKEYTATINNMRKSYVLFTELNHAFINPETEKYINTEDFQRAFADLKIWETENSPASMGYPNAYACFNEYMNWALVSLYCLDVVPVSEQEMLLSGMEKSLKLSRGFVLFPEFNRELIRLYRNRKPTQTVADLYPEILKWCKKQVM